MYEPSWTRALRPAEFSALIVEQSFDGLPKKDRVVIQKEINGMTTSFDREMGKHIAREILCSLGMFMAKHNLGASEIEESIQKNRASARLKNMEINDEDKPIWSEKDWYNHSW